MNKKATIIIFLIITLLFSSVLFADRKIEIATGHLPTFIKEGEVVTLLENNDGFFIKKEYFDDVGEYTQPATEKEISLKEYNLLKDSLDYDILETELIKTLQGNKYMIHEFLDRNKQILAGSYIDQVIEGKDSIIEFLSEGRKTILIQNGDRFFIKNTHIDKDNKLVEDNVIIEIDKDTFEDKKYNNNFDILKEYHRYTHKDTNFTEIKYFNNNLDIIGDPILSQWTGYTDLKTFKEDYFAGLIENLTPPENNVEDIEDNNDNNDNSWVENTDDEDDWWDIWEDGQGSDVEVINPEDINNSGSGSGSDNNTSNNTSNNTGGSGSINANKDKNNHSNLNNKEDKENKEDNDDKEKFGYKDDTGKFIETDKDGNVLLPISGHFDFDGNFWPDNEEFYYDYKGIRHPKEEINILNYYDKNNNFITNDKGYFDESGIYYSKLDLSKGGYYDEKKNFILEDLSGYIDKDGYYHENIDKNNILLNSLDIKDKTLLTVDKDGNLKVLGLKGYFTNDGLYHTTNEKIGYFNSRGEFIENSKNPYSTIGGFYDKFGNWYSYNSFYVDNLGRNRVVLSPDLGITIENNKIKIKNLKGSFDINGLYTENNKKGYFDKNGNFVEAKENPFKNGFYTDKHWISKDLFTINNNIINLNTGSFDIFGNYHTAYGDIGHFNNKNVFVPFELNQNTEGFYTNNTFYPFGLVYKDNLDNIFILGQSNFFTKAGVEVKGDYVLGQNIDDYKFNYNGIVFKNNQVGYINKDNKFIKGNKPFENGYYNTKGEYVKYDNKYKIGNSDVVNNFIINDDIIILPNGISIKTKKINDKTYSFGGLVINDGTLGFFNKDGKFEDFTKIKDFVAKEKDKIGYFDEKGNFIKTLDKPGFFDNNKNYHIVDSKGYFDSKGNFIEENNIYYFNDKKEKIDGTNPYINGFYTNDGEFIFYNDDFNKPLLSFFDKNGELIIGEKQKQNGFYDKFKNYHPIDGNEYFDTNGTIYKSGKNAIGFKTNTKFVHKNQNGYYNNKGTYIEKDLSFGYFNSKGEYIENKENIHIDGFYDIDKNWHIFGDSGYYKPNGEYVNTTTDVTAGYYNKHGLFIPGTNPYINGFYDKDNYWHEKELDGKFDADGNYIIVENNKEVIKHFNDKGEEVIGNNPYIDGYYIKDKFIKFIDGHDIIFFNKKGEKQIGSSPYIDGFYDDLGQWHILGQDGYYTKQGSLITKNNDFKYFDKFGQAHKGTNPLLNGFFDANKNWHPFDSDGYYAEDGTFYNQYGNIGYFTNEGEFIKDKRNTNKDGFYDEFKNFIPFDEIGYYNKDNQYVENVFKDNKFEYGNDNYIYQPGFFTNGFPNFLKKGGYSLQYTTNNNELNPKYIETGIAIPQNSIIDYEDISDALHGIAIHTDSKFIKDKDYSMLIYKGRILNIQRDKGVTLNQLKDIFMNTNIDLAIRKTRFEDVFPIVEAIETNQNISFYNNNVKHDFKLPLLSLNNKAYISIKDFAEIFEYRLESNNFKNTTRATLTTNSIDNNAKSISIIVNNNNIKINGENYNLEDTPTSVNIDNIDEIYIPFDILMLIVNDDITWDSNNYNLIIGDKDKYFLKAN